ncbi:ATP-dependent protease HslV [Thermobrachium celere DSM 8682]|uniref:ATP-dependent protease HslV n=1 Tax=Thermobrachium celere DSM 8682 TaxID=941824 RepID=R7RUF9_9CLOT|nr:ATP-dependent protease HslV [Thermobrachium celere DSM 8682]
MFRATTIVAVKKGNCVAIAGDGQVTLVKVLSLNQLQTK